MKKAFTLVEMLIVVVVLITLMMIVFKLSGVGRNQQRRNITVTRMQRLENCLSGYYAAFGTYPPVALHASQDPFTDIDDVTGSQRDSKTSSIRWASVREACRAQPLAARFPFKKSYKQYVAMVSRVISERASSDDDRFKDFRARASVLVPGFTTLENPNDVEGWDRYFYWQQVKIFKFGLMSFLLPRYLFMASGLSDSAIRSLDKCKQWTGNNRFAANQNTGQLFSSWEDELGTSSFSRRNLIQRIPSQAVTARWMPNLQGIVSSTFHWNFYGITIGGGNMGVNVDNPNIEICRSGNFQYVLDGATVYDGWDHEFYYHSEPPYQSYRLWSAGPNGKTFPPWYPLENIENAKDRRTAANWMADDIMFMSN